MQLFNNQFLFMTLIGIFWGFLCSKIAKAKNRNQYYWFILGFFLCLIALVSIIFLKPIKSSTSKNIIKQNPDQLSLINTDNNYWYYLDINKNQVGPMSLKKLFESYLEGIISDNTFVWNDTMTKWMKLKEVTIFSNIIKQAFSSNN